MTEQPCGFKLQEHLGTEQELTKIKKTAGDAWTRSSACVRSIKPSEVAVALLDVLGLLGGRSGKSTTNEHHTTGGRTDE